MKSIIYFILASFIYCTLTSGSQVSQNGNRIILLKPAINNVTTADLEQSATIISARLKVYGIEKPDVTTLPDKGQIKVQVPDNIELSEIEGLITLKGYLAFYGTFNRKEVSDLLKGDNQLFRLLKTDPGITPADSRIGCINAENSGQVNAYLKNIKSPDNCKFLWSYRGFNSDKSLRCLYALKTNSTGKPLLVGSDIETIKSEQEKDSQSFKISITFKKSAAGLWSEATRNNMNRAIAITVDNTIFYAPVVKAVIEKGMCEITGDMTQKDVNYFLALTNNAPLPITFDLVK
jgi:preprotein translocase subunit SecD